MYMANNNQSLACGTLYSSDGVQKNTSKLVGQEDPMAHVPHIFFYQVQESTSDQMARYRRYRTKNCNHNHLKTKILLEISIANG